MSVDVCQSVINYLQQEIDWVKALNDVLLKEKEILETNQLEQLTSIAETKQTLSENLEKSSRQRVALLQINPDNPEQHKSALEAFLNSLQTEQANVIRNLNETLAQQLHTCRERNNINGQVIATNVITRKAVIDSITSEAVGLDDNQATYNAKGDVKKNSRSGSSQEV